MTFIAHAQGAMAEPRILDTPDEHAEHSRLPDYLFQEKNGQWYGELGQYRLRSMFRPVYRRSTDTELILEGFAGVARIMASGREYQISDVLVAASPDDRLDLERICRVIHSRNFANSGGGRYRIYLPHSFMTRSGLPRYLEYIQKLPDRMSRFGLKPEQTVQELSEKSCMDRDVLLDLAEGLRSMGSKIALTEFGLQGSDSRLLEELRPEILGIDPALLQMAIERPDAADMLRSLVTVTAKRGIAVLIEGIDTSKQFEMAFSAGATLFRGDLLGRINPRLIRARVRIEIAELVDSPL